MLLSIHAALLAWSAARQAPTCDEHCHLIAGVYRLKNGSFHADPGNPPLFSTVAALPVVLAGLQMPDGVFGGNALGSDFVTANGARLFRLIVLGRWACIPFSLLGGWICFRWARDLWGHGSGMIALVIWCFCPNIIAHGQLITGDIAAASLGITAFYLFWKWLCEPSLGGAVFAGVALGAAELTKFIWVLLYLLWPLVWLVWRWLYRSQPVRWALVREAGQGLLVMLVSVYVIHLGYACEEPFHPLRQFDVGRSIIGWLGGGPSVEKYLGSVPVPLPANYVRGIGLVLGMCRASASTNVTVEQPVIGGPSSYLNAPPPPSRLGSVRQLEHDRWFFLSAFLFKLPLGVLALLAFSCVASLVPSCSNAWKTELLLLVSGMVILCCVSNSGVPRFVRYAFPVLPFVYIWASKTGQSLTRRPWITSAVVVGCLSWTVASSLFVFPHSLSYVNELAGGPRHGHEYFVDSNIDWGQDLLYLKRWLDEHPEARPLHLAYFGSIDPRSAGIEFSWPGDLVAHQEPQPGWYAISASFLGGLRWSIPDGAGGFKRVGRSECRPFLALRPAATAGYSIYIYHITRKDANRVRRELGLPELSGRDRILGRTLE